ncbi:MAG: glycosyltransferase family 2 protein [archaeon GB-1867-005]|nr:glycosyltransferase family 2 protein [Candidatus Culexmicrobium cathedralense]
MPLISIYGTVYNNAYIIENSISSLIRALRDFEERYELVIVENYSTDGTWEKLLKIKKQYENLRLFRYKCSRGKGRDIALRQTTGDFVMYLDFDCLFSRELGMIVERLSKLCMKGEIWNFGFSTRETMIEQIGGWKDLNFGEDWELLGRAIKRDVKIKIIPVRRPIRNIRTTENGVYGERRYTRGTTSYLSRKLRNLRDTVIGWNLNPAHVIYSNDNLARPSTFMLLILSAIYSFTFSNDPQHIKYKVYANTEYLLPEEVGLPKEWFYIKWENIDQTWSVVVKHVKEFIRKDKRIHFAILPFRKLLICFREYEVFKKSLEEHTFYPSCERIGKIILKQYF